MPAQHSPASAMPAADPPTAYTARIVAAGVAAAIGAVLTSMVDSRSTLVGTMLVAMTVSALGQAMRRPLDRIQRRLKGQDTAAPSPVPPVRAERRGGMGRSILLIGLLGFMIGMGVMAAREIAQAKAVAARMVQRIESGAPIQILVQMAPTALPARDADEEDAQPKKAATPADQAARHATPTPASERAARPTPEPGFETTTKADEPPPAKSDAPASTTTKSDPPATTTKNDAPVTTKPDDSATTTGSKTDAPATKAKAA